MNKRAFLAAPLALAIAACGHQASDAPTGTATDTIAAATASDESPAIDTSVVGPTDLTPADNATDTMSARQLDASAQKLKKQADAVEPLDEAQADRLEAQAKALQERRDARN